MSDKDHGQLVTDLLNANILTMGEQEGGEFSAADVWRAQYVVSKYFSTD